MAHEKTIDEANQALTRLSRKLHTDSPHVDDANEIASDVCLVRAGLGAAYVVDGRRRDFLDYMDRLVVLERTPWTADEVRTALDRVRERAHAAFELAPTPAADLTRFEDRLDVALVGVNERIDRLASAIELLLHEECRVQAPKRAKRTRKKK